MDRREFLWRAVGLAGSSYLLSTGCSSSRSSGGGAGSSTQSTVSDLTIEEDRLITLRTPQTYFTKPVDPDGDYLSAVVLVGDNFLFGANPDGSWNPLRGPRGVIRPGDGALIFDTALWPTGTYRLNLGISGPNGLEGTDWLQTEKLTASPLVRENGPSPGTNVVGVVVKASGKGNVLVPFDDSVRQIPYTGTGSPVKEFALPTPACQLVLLCGRSLVSNSQRIVLLPLDTPLDTSTVGPVATGEIAELHALWDSAQQTWNEVTGNAATYALNKELDAVVVALNYQSMAFTALALANARKAAPTDPYRVDSKTMQDLASVFLTSTPFSKLLDAIRAGSQPASMSSFPMNFYETPQWWLPGNPGSDAAYAFGSGTIVSWETTKNSIEFVIEDGPNTSFSFYLNLTANTPRVWLRNLLVAPLVPAQKAGLLTPFKLQASFSVPR